MNDIEEVKQRTDIVEVVGQYTTLKKAGRNLTALCPFHNEKTPSFFVFPEQQSWHCFGACSTGGDVISFIMKKEGLDFGDALRLLAERVGYTLTSRAARPEEKEEKAELYGVNEAAALYFNNNLLNSPAAEKARGYVERRGFTAQTVADFQLGFSMDSWEALKQYLLEKGHTESTMLTAGLLIEGENGKTHDRFRGKLMIPIWDSRGRTIGFGGRALDNSMPKYTNSPQTPTFDKSGTLYGLDRAAAAIRKQEAAIIMEGYMDVITAHQNGITNVVASMGTAITETQVTALKKLSRNLLLALDADAAGEEAMLRTVGYESIVNAEIKVITLPEGKDPDDLIKEDAAAWNTQVAHAVPIVDYSFDKATAQLDLTTAGDKSHAVDKLLPIVAGIKDPVRQAHYLQKLAGLVNVDMHTIEAALTALKPAPARRRSTVQKPAGPARAARPVTSSPREEYCLALLLQYPELRDQPPEVLPDYFERSDNREIFAALQKAGKLSAVKENLDPALHEHFDAIAGTDFPVKNNVERRYADCVIRLREHYLRNVAAKKAAAENSSDDISWLEENLKISAQMKELDTMKNHKRSQARR